MLLSVLAAALALAPPPAPADTVPLASLDLANFRQGWGAPVANQSVQHEPLTIGGRSFARGVGSHAPGVAWIRLDGHAERFRAWVGVDDETAGRGSITCRIYGDGEQLFATDTLKGGDAPVRVDIDLRAVTMLALVLGEAGDGMDWDHADWAEAEFDMREGVPVAISAPDEGRVIRTPKPGPEPRINGPTVYGVRPGHEVLYRIPATGERPITFAADALPDGLTLDPDTGIITGAIADPTHARQRVLLGAHNARGSCAREFTFVVGDTLALTPPMGWNSWYIHYNRVTDGDIRAAADAMIDSGMADYGYSTVNIDDCWMARAGPDARAPDGSLRTGPAFPDMAALAAFIHARGLKAGLYTSPGPATCAGYEGAWGHEEQDARLFAAWGFDFLKYDWCTYDRVATGEGRESFVAPYRKMADILSRLDRDVVLNLCQYGMDDVWAWGGDVGQCWRTTGDLGNEMGGLLPGFYAIGLSNAEHWPYARPGAWNDPDYILIGWVGDSRGMGVGQPTTLTGEEQYAYMSMWSLMAAPLIFSGDMTRLDEFTLNVLCNAEVIAIDQDPLGAQARIVRHTAEDLVLAKPLEDGSLAIGLFNLGEVERTIQVTWKELKIAGPHSARDLWRQTEIGVSDGAFQSSTPRHSVTMVRLASAPRAAARPGSPGPARTATRGFPSPPAAAAVPRR